MKINLPSSEPATAKPTLQENVEALQQTQLEAEARIESYVKWIENDYATKKAKLAKSRGFGTVGKLNYLEPPRADTAAGELQEEVNEAFRRFRERNRL